MVLVAVTFAGGSGSRLDVLRLTAAGQPDPTFGTAGVVTVVGPGLVLNVERAGLTLEPGGEILVAGNTDIASGGNMDLLLARPSAAGTLDSRFGTVTVPGVTTVSSGFAHSFVLVS